ncbi:MAG TPA: Ig-like domain-containing protein [Planctomycetota bacterium]|nr:Ig-like domain-containing protein [Planctomycetota bacterium]
MISCDLGCGQTGCAITEIAENQRLRFVFSDTIAPASVNGSSVSFRTPTGVQPDGDLLVSGRELTFVPRVRTVNGVSSFGFLRNESYIITFAGGVTGAQSIRSVSGATLSQEFSCTVLASRGILDEDMLPPTVELLSPTNLTAAPLDPTIVLRFSELIDTTPLQGPIGEASPIRLLLRGTVGGLCDRDAEGIALTGVPRLSTELVGQHEVTVVTIQPSVTLPGNSCVTVSVTADIRDLSGRQGIPADFEFITIAGVSMDITITEPFANETHLDIPISGGSWNSGARPAAIGGDGRHGSFVPTDGAANSAGEFEFSTDGFQVTAERSLLGVADYVTDGKFYFSDFVVPDGTKVRFVGTVPPQIHVRGRAEIRGSILINGAQMPFWVPTAGLATGQKVSSFDSRGGTSTTTIIDGQLGGSPGVGGGRGGKGGSECPGSGPVFVSGVSINNGLPGQNVSVPAGHAYAGSVGGTAGQGSVMTPSTGMLPVSPPLCGSIYRAMFSPGGSGGGYNGPGGLSTATALATTTVGIPMQIGPAPTVGAAFPIPLPMPLPPNYTSLNHFLIGGSGGGGGGSHMFATQQFIQNANGQLFLAGSGGTGGGGALALRVGRDLVVGNMGVLNARGGDGVLINGDSPTNVSPGDIDYGISSPGGGGSGGSLLLQSATTISVAGTLDVSGGTGSRTGSITPSTINCISQAGSGAPGFYRLEANGNISFGGTGVPAYVPAQNAGPLNDKDQYSGCTSKWYGSGTIFPPQWLRYELDVDVNGTGTITTFTDSGAGTPANEPGNPLGAPMTIPVSIVFQGALLNQAGTEPLPGPANEWRPGIGSGAGQGIGLNPSTGFRFNLTFNRAMFPNAVVRALRVYART